MNDAPFAFLIHKDHVYLARHAASRPGEPHSAVTQLIRGIYQSFPGQARLLLRSRIFTDYEPTLMCRLTLKVAAKRCTGLSPAEAASRLEAALKIFPLTEIPALSPPAWIPCNELIATPDVAIHFLETVLKSACASVTGPRYLQDRPIAAVLVGPDGEALGVGVNLGSENKTLHAEINAFRAFYLKHGKPIPAGSTLYSTLKPCRMCAATLIQACEDWRSLRVVYRDFDPGPNGRSTLLDAGSPDRRRICSSASDLNHGIQFHLPQK